MFKIYGHSLKVYSVFFLAYKKKAFLSRVLIQRKKDFSHAPSTISHVENKMF